MVAPKPDIAPPDPEEAAGEPAPAPVASDADGWSMLDQMRRKIDDHGTLARKTQTQLVALAESIAALVEDQRRRTNKLNLNSFVAYLIFTVLLGGGFYFLFQSRASEVTNVAERAERERDAATKRATDAEAAARARADADAKAWEVYELLEAGKRSEAKDKLAALGNLPLSKTERAILTATAHETQVVAVDAALKNAIASFKAGKYGEMIAPLETALAGEPAGARAISMHYYLGIAYAKQSELEKAIAHLVPAVAGDVDQDDARFQLASALDRNAEFPRARAEYDRFATAHPQHPLAVFAMRRSATLARMPAVTPKPPGAGSGSAAPGSVVPGAGSAAPKLAPGVGSAAPKPAAGSGSAARPAPIPAVPTDEQPSE